jgi:hypothetical protein
VDVEHEILLLRGEEEVLAPPPRAGEPATLQGGERRVVGLQRGDVCRPRARDRKGGDGIVQRLSIRLDLGKLGNSSSSWTRSA